jgi:hypothetical protein
MILTICLPKQGDAVFATRLFNSNFALNSNLISLNFSVSKQFIEWIGKPDLDAYSVLILNFLATEIVSQMVENALLIRVSDTKYQGQILNGHMVPLEVLHYKGALRRNLGYQTNGNLLFGYVVASVN